ncbi:MAG TPA: hypothetical protein VF024_20345, partial [Solirubrobacteraceae bacterium]
MATARIRPGTAVDAPLVLALFDEAVAWLVARRQPGQWAPRRGRSDPARSSTCRGGRRVPACASPWAP